MMATSAKHLSPRRSVTVAPRRKVTPQRNHLRLLPAATNRRESQRKKLQRKKDVLRVRFWVMAALTVALFVFGLVFLNIAVAQGSFRLQNLQSEVAREEAMYREMRFRVASAESPQRVAEAATSIGLVVPDHQKYIVGPPDLVQVASEANEESPDAESKAMLKSR